MFQVNYCEFNRSNVDYDRIYRPGGSGDYLLLLFKTPMKCYLKDTLQISRENACLLYAPKELQNYQAVQKFFNSYVHFSTDLCLEEKYGIATSQLLYPENFPRLDALIQEIQREYLFKEPFYQERCQALLETLFILLSRSLSKKEEERSPDFSELLPVFQKLRLRMLQSCEENWSVERLCRETNLSKSQFFCYYHRFFSASPKAELLEARMEKARTLLTNEALQIQQVAHLCGFSNMQHFSRYFKSRYHCSPRAYKELHGKASF